MAGTILIMRGFPMKLTYQPYIFYGSRSISYCTIPIDGAIEPGVYEIPVDQRDNLEWFYDNLFRFNAYGRKHVGEMMAAIEPDTVWVY